MSFIPKFMRTPTWGILGLSLTGGVTYMTYKYQLDQSLRHPLVEEAIHLLENNEEVLEIVGAPVMIDSSVRNRADIGSDISNFSFKVTGPRGNVKVEMASCSRKLQSLGPNLAGKNLLKEKARKTGQDVTIPNNVNEFNFNEYNIPGLEVVQEEDQLYKHSLSGPLDPKSTFWHIEYLFAEVDDGLRIMVAPVPQAEKEEEPILGRQSYEDLIAEYEARRNSRRDFRKAQTQEEQDEMRKFRIRKMYKNMAYTRFYLLMSLFIGGMSAYIMFRKNKRTHIVNNMLHEKAKWLIETNPKIIERCGENLLFPSQTLGARIGNDAEFQFVFMGEGHYGKVNVDSVYVEKDLKWKINQFGVELFNEKGEKIEEEFDFEF